MNTTINEAVHVDVVTAAHPLLSREVRPIYNWNEFLELWENARTYQEMSGLLHVGFETGFRASFFGEKEYCEEDRLIFYFSIADSWSDRGNFSSKEDGEHTYQFGCDRNGSPSYKKQCDFRQKLAQKAFDILCQNFFKREIEIKQHLGAGKDDLRLWGLRFVHESQLLSCVQSFFRAEEGYFHCVIRNLSSGRDDQSRPGQQHPFNFLLALAMFVLGWKEKECLPHFLKSQQEEIRLQNAQIRSSLDLAKPWAVEVLYCLSNLEVLWKVCGPKESEFISLNASCLKKLKEIALGSMVTDKSQKFTNLTEACYADSKAGWFLKMYELKKNEYQRLEAVRKAKQARIEGKSKSKKLDSK